MKISTAKLNRQILTFDESSFGESRPNRDKIAMSFFEFPKAKKSN